MDDAAFRASVFAEQKQLTAFSLQAPNERKKLVLQLLGITPLDAARDLVAQGRADSHRSSSSARASCCPTWPALEAAAADAEQQAAAAEAAIATARATSSPAARGRLEAAQQRFDELDG